MKSQITQKTIIFPMLFSPNYVREGYQELIAIFYLVKIKYSKDILGSLKCKVSFGFKYINGSHII